MKRAFNSFLRIFVSLAFIIILLYIMRGKYGEIFSVLKGTNSSIFILGLLVFTGAITVASVRLKLIIEAQGIPVTFFEALSLTFIGYFFNNFLPTAIGGDVVKAYYLSKKTDDKIGSYTSVFVDRVIGLVTMVFMAFVALFCAGSNVIDDRVRYIIYIITAVSIVGIIFMMNKKFARLFSVLLVFFRPIEEKLKKSYNAVHIYKKNMGLIVQSFFISIISQVLFFLSLGILALSLGSRIPMVDIFLRLPIISALSILPSLNGLGLREGSTVVFFGPLIGKENAFALSILWLLMLFIISLFGGMIYAVSPQFKVRLKDIERGDVLA